MTNKFNVYCDETCWMQYDNTKISAWGAIRCPTHKAKLIHNELREIKRAYNMPPDFEVKWTKVSKGKLDFYRELIRYFFSNNYLQYRGLLVPEKSILNHKKFQQTHSEWYYKMYFDLLKFVIFDTPNQINTFNLYFDLTDKWQPYRLKKLSQVFNSYLSYPAKHINLHFQGVDSKEVGIIQLTDLITGAIGYINRGLNTNSAKLSLIEDIRNFSNLSLLNSTAPRRNKFDLLIWHPKEQK
ncbi:MAG: DUF3800 domain-containing protein [Anaerolineaceae bacterium]|nr:DUF3800 domain-containing protein [Anaerolineaceae bacterium]